MNKDTIVTALNEKGKKVKFILLDTILVDGNKYAILSESKNDEDAYIYKVKGNNSYELIDDDEEYNKVFDALS